MRHRNERTKITNLKCDLRSTIRNQMTSLVLNGYLKTTASRKYFLVSSFNSLVNSVMRQKTLREKIRIVKKYIYSNSLQVKFVDYVLKLDNKKSSFLKVVRLNDRKGDGAPLFLINVLD